ncbi:MAG: radical SAM protein [Clostridia bacterium]|nr:radical SAM protein [Clostridia bacterium]
MKEPANAFELLEMLREKNGKQIQYFSGISRYLGLKAREKGIPLSNQFELTPLCNFSCRMCYVHLTPEQLNDRSVLSVGAWKELIYQSWQAGMIQATLTGGECLVYPDFDELFLYLHSLGCEVAVLTNGFLLDDRRIQFFKEHKPARIQVTLYGWNDDVYERVTGQRAFGVVTENIRKAIDAGLPVFLNVTPSIFLGEDVLETVRAAKKISRVVTVNSALFSPRKETGRSEQDADSETDLYIRLYRLINELDGTETKEIDESLLPPAGGPNHECKECGLRCGGGRSGFVIDWQGTMMPCNRMEMIRAYPLQEGIQSAWAKVNHAANSWPRVPECEGCVYYQVCNNCAGNQMRFAEPGKLPVALCEQTKQFVCHGVRPIPECE